jgi:DNA-binding NarL/FixJ family response regulator
MPIMSGLEALSQIIRYSPHTKVVMFTLDNADDFRRKALDLGASAYVNKSAPIEELFAEVRKLLAQKP